MIGNTTRNHAQATRTYVEQETWKGGRERGGKKTQKKTQKLQDDRVIDHIWVIQSPLFAFAFFASQCRDKHLTKLCTQTKLRGGVVFHSA
jgi:hypothetical protein